MKRFLSLANIAIKNATEAQKRRGAFQCFSSSLAKTFFIFILVIPNCISQSIIIFAFPQETLDLNP